MGQALSWLDASNLPTHSMILDSGCGTGVVASEVAKRGYKAFAMDYSYGMLKKASDVSDIEGTAMVDFLNADVEYLPFKDSSFDTIICLGVITYLKFAEMTLSEFSRVMKSGGTLILSSLNKTHLVRYLDLPNLAMSIVRKTIAKRIASWNKHGDNGEVSVQIRSYHTLKLISALEHQGFSVVEYITVPLGLITFFGYDIPPKRLNIRISLFFERFLNIPFIGPLGGMCMFRAVKSGCNNS